MVHVNPHQEALQTLKERGNGQHFYDFDLDTQISEVRKFLELLDSSIYDNSYLDRDYITPKGVEVNSYSPKHPPSHNFPEGTPQEEIRTQAGVGNQQFLRSMIPHHAAAILVCQQSSITKPRIKELCTEIVWTQKEEIAIMKELMNE